MRFHGAPGLLAAPGAGAGVSAAAGAGVRAAVGAGAGAWKPYAGGGAANGSVPGL